MATRVVSSVANTELYLDIGPLFRYKQTVNLAHVKDASRVTAAGGASAVPAGGGSSLLFSGGLGISLPTLGPAREVLAATGSGARRDTPAIYGRLPREAWPEAEPLGCMSPSGKNRGGTPEGVRIL
jgi:hypothetical protein